MRMASTVAAQHLSRRSGEVQHHGSNLDLEVPTEVRASSPGHSPAQKLDGVDVQSWVPRANLSKTTVKMI